MSQPGAETPGKATATATSAAPTNHAASSQPGMEMGSNAHDWVPHPMMGNKSHSQDPAVRPGEPVAESMRRQLAQLMEEASDWMEEHRLTVRAAALAAAAGGLAFLLHTGHVAGWRQYGSMAELPLTLLGPEARRLPIVLHSMAQHGDALAVRAAHYPLLRRLLDRYRRVTPQAAARRAAASGQLLTCHLAGPLQPTQAGLQYLQGIDLEAVQHLRLLSIVHAADQTWTTAGTAGTAGGGGKSWVGGAPSRLLGADSGSSGSQGGVAMEVTCTSSCPSTATTAQGQPGGELYPSALEVVPGQGQQQQPGAAPAASVTKVFLPDPAAGAAGAAGAAREVAGVAGPEFQQSSASPDLLWGELYARVPRRTWLAAALLPVPRVDVAQELIARGEAAMMEPIDMEWLGVGWPRIDRLYLAEQAAIQAGLGMWAVRRPTLAEWSRSLARSAWVRVRHAARSTASATASGISGAAASAGSGISSAAAAASGAVVQATSAAASSLNQAAATAAKTGSEAGVQAKTRLGGLASAAGSGLGRAAAAMRKAATGVLPASGKAAAGVQAAPTKTAGAAEAGNREAEASSSGVAAQPAAQQAEAEQQQRQQQAERAG